MKKAMPIKLHNISAAIDKLDEILHRTAQHEAAYGRLRRQRDELLCEYRCEIWNIAASR